MTAAAPARRRRRRYTGPLVIRVPVPEGASALCALIDAERAAERRRSREQAYHRTWRGRLDRGAQLLRGLLA